MPRKKRKQPAARPSVSIGGNVGGSVVVGDHNVQVGSAGPGSTVIAAGQKASQTFDARQMATLQRLATAEEIASLAGSFQRLDDQIDQEAPPEVKDEARGQVEGLKQSVTGDNPDVSGMERAKGWFVDHLPSMLGTVTSILTHPIVGKLVEAAGEFTLDQFRARLGLPGAPPSRRS